MSRILVTGANGFVGRNIVNALSGGHFVIGSGRQTQSQSNCEEYVKWDLHKDDIPNNIAERGIDCIVHAAASLTNNDLSEELVYTNCVGTYRVVKLAKECDAKCIIYISSLPIIGNCHTLPITENAALAPQTMYHATKAAGELIANQATDFGIKVASLRVPSPIGLEMPKNTIVPTFIRRALSGEDIILQGRGTRRQNYIDVRDIGEAVRRLIEREGIDGVFNIGSKNIISNKELAYLCVDCLNSKANITFSGNSDALDDIDWTTDDSKLKGKIGDYQTHSMKDSIIDIAGNMS